MIETLVILLLLGLILYGLYYIIGKFVQGTVLYIIGAIIALVYLLYALRRLGLLNSLNF